MPSRWRLIWKIPASPDVPGPSIFLDSRCSDGCSSCRCGLYSGCIRGQSPTAPFVVGIGDPAGLEALVELLGALLATGVPFIVVQQLDPTHEACSLRFWRRRRRLPCRWPLRERLCSPTTCTSSLRMRFLRFTRASSTQSGGRVLPNAVSDGTGLRGLFRGLALLESGRAPGAQVHQQFAENRIIHRLDQVGVKPRSFGATTIRVLAPAGQGYEYGFLSACRSRILRAAS